MELSESSRAVTMVDGLPHAASFSLRAKFDFSMRLKNICFLVTKINKFHFLCVCFGSNLESTLDDIRWLDPVLVSLHLVGYSKSYRWPKIFKNLRSLEKVLQTLVCSSRMNSSIDCTSHALLNDYFAHTNIIEHHNYYYQYVFDY